MPSSLAAPERVRSTARALRAPRRPWSPARHSTYQAPRGTTALAFGVLALIGGGAVAVGELTDVPAAAESTVEQPPGSLSALAEQLDVVAAWNAGFTGAGVNVAIIDTGVAPVDALDDNVVVAVDFSAEAADRATATVDTYGHGTHLAGIVAGNDESAGFRGLAPDAGIVSVKVAGADGTVQPQALVDGIGWVVDHADDYDVRVITLAFNADEATPEQAAALDAVVARAWDAGIVVVAAAGNHGDTAPAGLYAPATSEDAIVVGAVEATDTGLEPAEFSSRGDARRMPDLAAPGAHIESLRAPGSTADTDHPEGFVDEHRFLATGTSQSAAAVSALAALVLDAHPDLTPDQVRAALVAASDQVGSPPVTGAGVPSAMRAIEHAAGIRPWSSGAWSSGAWSSGAWSSGAWSSGAWSSGAWSSGAWSSGAWSSGAWSSGAWSSGAWSSGAWSSGAWSSGAWSSGAWSSGAWSSGAWS